MNVKLTVTTLVILGGSLAVAWNSGLMSPAQQGGGESTVRVLMCDNQTTIDVKPGATQDEGKRIADSLMEQWRRNHPNQGWEDDVVRAHPAIPKPIGNRELLADGQSSTYGAFTEADVALWERETWKLVLEGARVFHDAKALGSTISVSCDMCHPDAANTHPETYPKYQLQMGRVVLLRDMINWCLQHPVRAPAIQPDDPRMRALEAYILAQRQGKPIQYGKH